MPDYSSAYDRERLRVVRSLLPTGKGEAVDIGCYDGTTTAMVAALGYQAIGYDIDEDALRRARHRHPELTFRKGSAEDAREVSGRYLTVCLEVIEHLPYEEQGHFLGAISDGTKPGGRLVLSTPGCFSLLSLYERCRGRLRGETSYDWWDPTHIGVMSCRRLERSLRDSGFEPLQRVGVGFLPERLHAPFALSWPPLSRMGFDLIIVAARR